MSDMFSFYLGSSVTCSLIDQKTKHSIILNNNMLVLQQTPLGSFCSHRISLRGLGERLRKENMFRLMIENIKK